MVQGEATKKGKKKKKKERNKEKKERKKKRKGREEETNEDVEEISTGSAHVRRPYRELTPTSKQQPNSRLEDRGYC